MPALRHVVSLALCVAGILLILEVVRPFHDLAIDGPLALTCWGVGALLSGVGFFLRRRAIIWNTIGFAVNVLPLIGALVLWWMMSRSNFLWH